MFECQDYTEQRKLLVAKLKESWDKFEESKHLNAKTLVFGHVRQLAKGEKRELDGQTQRRLWLCLAEFVRGSKRFPSQFGLRNKALRKPNF